MLRSLIVLTVAAASAALGQILLRRGMLEIGSPLAYGPLELAAYFWRSLTNPYVVSGTTLNAVFYFLFLAALSWTELTIALPLTALEYAFAAVLAAVLLGEAVPPMRWIGIGLVILGVMLITVLGGERSA